LTGSTLQQGSVQAGSPRANLRFGDFIFLGKISGKNGLEFFGGMIKKGCGFLAQPLRICKIQNQLFFDCHKIAGGKVLAGF